MIKLFCYKLINSTRALYLDISKTVNNFNKAKTTSVILCVVPVGKLACILSSFQTITLRARFYKDF